MKKTITGQCLCNAVNYSIEGRIIRSGFCYCQGCQKKSGADHIPFIVISAKNATITGPITWYEYAGDSGQAKQFGFCSNCGSTLLGNPLNWEKIFVIYAGSLDSPEDFSPEMNLWLDEAPSWSCINESLKAFAGNPI